jgi:hypothetical protein
VGETRGLVGLHSPFSKVPCLVDYNRSFVLCATTKHRSSTRHAISLLLRTNNNLVLTLQHSLVFFSTAVSSRLSLFVILSLFSLAAQVVYYIHSLLRRLGFPLPLLLAPAVATRSSSR